MEAHLVPLYTTTNTVARKTILQSITSHMVLLVINTTLISSNPHSVITHSNLFKWERQASLNNTKTKNAHVGTAL